MATDSQQDLGFAEAEGSHAERRNWLGLALMRVDCDLALKELCMWIFNVTAGGLSGAGEFRKTMQQIAERPWGLCCSANTARRVVKRAVTLGLVEERQTVAANGGDAANAYTIDWEGVRALLDTTRRPGSNRGKSAPRPGVPPGNLVGGATNLVGGTTNLVAPYKEHPPLSLLFNPGDSNPAAAAQSLSVDAWTAAAEELRGVGCDNADQLVEVLRARGHSPADAAPIAAVLRANPDRFERPGSAAWFFLENGRWPANGLRDPAAVDRRRAAADERRQADDARRADAEADELRLEALLNVHGPSIDRLSADELGELAAAAGLAGPALAALRRAGWRSSPLVRGAILEAFVGALR